MGVVRCGTRKSGKTPPFSPIFQPICMQIRPLHILRKGKASKHAQRKLLNFHPFYLVFTWFYLRNTLGLYFVVTQWPQTVVTIHHSLASDTSTNTCLLSSGFPLQLE